MKPSVTLVLTYEHRLPRGRRKVKDVDVNVELPQIGSKWYAWGTHVEIIEHTTLDGLPAIRERRLNDGKKLPPVLAFLFLKKAAPL